MNICYLFIVLLLWGCSAADLAPTQRSSTDSSLPEAHNSVSNTNDYYPKTSPYASILYELQSNKERTHFYVDGNELPAGRRLKILIDDKPHTVIAQPEGCVSKEEFIQPPYNNYSPLSFTFLIGECSENKKISNTSLQLVAQPIVAPVSNNKFVESFTSEASPPPDSAGLKAMSSQSAALPASERRVALIIGNSNYTYAPKLVNPKNDAEDVASILKRLNFQVYLKTDATLETMADAIFSFGESLKGGGVGLFYYSGHGLQVKGENYLLPVDANLMREDDVKRKAISANDILEKMGEGKSHLNFVFMDACRNNPFPSSTRAISRGLIGMSAPNGTLLVYSTNPDNVALDGSGRNGTYTKHLLEYLESPNLEIGMMLRKIRTAVKQETNGQQVPWENGSIEGEFFFNPSK